MVDISLDPEEYDVWSHVPKEGVIDKDLASRYEQFVQNFEAQRENWKRTECYQKLNKPEIENKLSKLGLVVDWNTGKLSYMESFEPLHLDYELCIVRHGQTEGNKEPRIFQGYVDYEENQLTAEGRKQANRAADLLDAMITSKIFSPNLVVVSPLGRAKETAWSFTKRHPEIPIRIEEKASEMKFGDWDNVQLRYLDKDHICHLFHANQNVLVKAERPHMGPNGPIEPESFVDVLERQADLLQSISQLDQVVEYNKNRNEKSSPYRVIIYSHSMVGAACAVLLGKGSVVGGNIAFDGKSTIPNATPIILHATNKPASMKD